ncbi:TOPRIM nucleotidyl transferase/hydrolase domain-containing protein [Cupriavidus basilensis]|uniref:TOPRIM nucleotidyl transferase/hydrolase domain-containing protein n=1 Tax=Cupriavidus basilensis TaxID=68895 RepID=UPI0006804860|nr:TOPRIM nucleotidyl transferase/hydrolase domain-containing protein [Cupriavidus basilensis]
MFFTHRLILVEGIEDVAYTNAWLTLTDRMQDFRRTGCHLVPVNGKEYLARPAIIAEQMRIPVYVIFDADTDREHERDGHHHLKDNTALLRLLGGDQNAPFPTETIWGARY